MGIIVLILGLAVALYFWKISYKYALLGFILGLITFSGIFFIIRFAVSANLLPQNLPNPNMESFSYLPGLYFGIVYSILSAVLGTLIELAINQIQKRRY